MTLLRRLGPALFAVFGVVMAFHPMILSGLARMETDLADARHLNYVFEHGYQWLRSSPGHTDFWSPPVFFPEQNTAAYSETLLGVLPFYLFWRFFGFPPDTSLQLWTLTVSLLNFAAAYLLIRRLLLRSALASCLGAFVFAFGSPRIVHSQHHHLLPQFFTLLVVASLIVLFRRDGPEKSRWRSTAWIILLFAGIVAQFYACFYLAWLLVLALGAAGVAACLIGEVRAPLISLVSDRWVAILVCAALAAVAIAPLARHSLQAASVVGYRSFEDVAVMLPTPSAWWNVGPYSWLYRGLWRPLGFADMPYEGAKRLGAGFLTTIMVGYGLFRERGRPGVRVLLGSSVALIVLATTLPGGYSPWKIVYALLPGANAIRAVGRLAFVLLVPASIGVSYAFDQASRVLPKALLLFVAAVVILEQGQMMPSYDKQEAREGVERIVERVPRGCESFFVASPDQERRLEVMQVDAMWAGTAIGLPTVNGYSSNIPPGWFPLFDNRIHGPGDEARIQNTLKRWLVSHGRDPARTCLVLVR